MNTKIHTYKEVYVSNIKLYSDGSCTKHDTYNHHVREVINKMACFNIDDDDDFISELSEETCDTSFSPGSALYVASECKTARDTFRNSGYSITRSRDKADAIVVPDIRREYFYLMRCNLVAYDEKNEFLYLFNICKPGYLTSQISDVDLAHVRNHLKNEGLIPDEIQRADIKVWFIPKCDELVNVMTNSKVQNVPYIQESMVPIKASTNISAETLVFWENISDENLLVRTICTSDWMKYPLTVGVFLTYFKPNINWYNFANNDFRRILKSIGYEYYYGSDYILDGDKMIEPQDYEMLQAYLYYKLGLAETGGYVKAKQFDVIPLPLRKFIRQMIVTKPVSIPVKMRLDNLSELVSQ